MLNDTHMKFSLPSSRKEMKDVCIQFDDGDCSSAGALSYIALPHCSLVVPATTWIRYRLDPERASLLLEEGHVHQFTSIAQIHAAMAAAPRFPSLSVFFLGVTPGKMFAI